VMGLVLLIMLCAVLDILNNMRLFRARLTEEIAQSLETIASQATRPEDTDGNVPPEKGIS
jgi:hypothetical protein